MSSSAPSKPKASQRADEFVTNFGRARALILRRIENLKPGDENMQDVNSKLTVLSNDIQEMSLSLHDATLFLPAFSIKMRQEEIRELEKALKGKEDLLIPKKKFGFKSKLQEVKSENISNESEETVVPPPTSIDPEGPSQTSGYLTIENVSNESLVHEDSELNKNDVLVRNIQNSTLSLHGSPSTLRLVNLTGCKLLCGPVFTSIFIEDCRDCVFFLSCQQLRVHSSETLDIYLRVRARAVIEDCSRIRFGPYTWTHPKSAQLHLETEINENMERFDCIDDFNWLAFTTPSPNWAIIPPAERVGSILESNGK